MSRPEPTASAAAGSASAAASVSSRSRSAAPLAGWPASPARCRASRTSRLTSTLRRSASRRSSASASCSCASRSAPASAKSSLDLLALSTHQEVGQPHARRRLAEPLHLPGEGSLAGFASLPCPRLSRRDELARREPVELACDPVEIHDIQSRRCARPPRVRDARALTIPSSTPNGGVTTLPYGPR